MTGSTQQTIQMTGRKYMFDKFHEWLKNTFGTKEQEQHKEDVTAPTVEVEVQKVKPKAVRKPRKKSDDTA